MTTPGDASEDPQSEGSAPPPPPPPPGSYPAPPLPPPPSYTPPSLGPSPAYGGSATRLAYWSLVSSGIGIVTCGIGSVIGIVLGLIALTQINRTNQRGRGLAIAGIVVGALWTLIMIIAFSHMSGSS